jgi:hypothetical protein
MGSMLRVSSPKEPSMHVSRRWMLLLAGAASLVCYQDDPFGQVDAGATTVLLTDAGFPFELVDRVEVYVSEIAASTDADSAGQEWVTITRPGKTFDVLELQHGRTALVGWGELPPGSYRAVRVSLRGGSSRVVMRDGREASVRWPALGEFSVLAWVQETVAVSDTGVQIVIDLDVGRSFVNALQDPLHDFAFLAHVRAVNSAVTGTLTGTVTGDADGDGIVEVITNAAVTVSLGDSATTSPWFAIATGHTAADGVYRVAFLVPGTYRVQIAAPGSAVFGSVSEADVTIVQRQVTTHSVELTPPDASALGIAR